jgi:hypothetical protein
MRKIRLGVEFIILMLGMMLMFSGNALAAPYYEAGTPDNNTAATALVFGYYTGTTFSTSYSAGSTLALKFSNGGNGIYGPSGDILASDPTTYAQLISGIYTLSAAGGNVYNLTLVSGGSSTIKVTDGTTNFLTASATALQINFGTDSIAWSDVTNVNIDNTIGSQALTDLAASSTYAFSSFTFEQLALETTWLSGGAGVNARYYSQLDGFPAAPEPGEWVLMIVGLGLAGFYARRKGFLSSTPSPQALA